MASQLDIRPLHRRNLLRVDALGDQNGILALLPSFRQHEPFQKLGLRHYVSEHTLCNLNLVNLLLAMYSFGCVLSPRIAPTCEVLGQIHLGICSRSICKSFHLTLRINSN